MSAIRSPLHWKILLASPILLTVALAAQEPTPAAQVPGAVTPAAPVVPKAYPPAQIQSGRDLFRQNCSFCHGRDAGGGETGPDLTRSKLVTEDVDGDKIGPVVRNGRPDKGMPPFNFSDPQITALAAFIHTQQKTATTRKGGRKGVDVADLQT